MELELKKMYIKAKNTSILSDTCFPFQKVQNYIQNMFESRSLFKKVNLMQFKSLDQPKDIKYKLNRSTRIRLDSVKNAPHSLKSFKSQFFTQQFNKYNHSSQLLKPKNNQQAEILENEQQINKVDYSQKVMKYLKQVKNKEKFKKTFAQDRQKIIQQAIEQLKKSTFSIKKPKIVRRTLFDQSFITENKQIIKNRNNIKLNEKLQRQSNLKSQGISKRQENVATINKNEVYSIQLPQIQTKPSKSFQKRSVNINTQERFFINQIRQMKKTNKLSKKINSPTIKFS